MAPAKKPSENNPSGKDDPTKKTPEKKYVPGYDPVSDDEKNKGPKKSRRRKKAGNKDEPSEAGPSSTVASSSSAQTGNNPGTSVPKSSTSTGTSQPPVSTSARQPMQAPNQPTTALPYLTRPIQSSTHASAAQAGQSSSHPGQAALSTRPTSAPGPASGPPATRSLPAPSNPNEAALAGKASSTDPSKESSSSSGDGKQEFVRLKGQPPRPVSNSTNHLPLATNYFKLIIQGKLKLCHYQIIVRPEIKGPKLTQVIKLALRSRTIIGLARYIVTDFSAIMLSMQEIPQQCTNFKIQYMSEVETQASANASEYTIFLDLIGNVDISDPRVYLQHMDLNPSGLSIEQALDIVLGHHRKLSNNVAIVNRRKAFSVTANAEQRILDTSHFLTALRGYFSSVRMSQSSLLVNINISHGAFYTAPRKLSEVITWLEDHQHVARNKIPGLLRGLRVQSSHIPRVWSFWGNPRKGDGRGYMLHPPKFPDVEATWYTPQQISFFHEEVEGPSQERTQKLNDRDKESAKAGRLKPHKVPCSCSGEWLTVAEYFTRIRREPILQRDMGFYVVNVGSDKRPTYLPSHLCTIMNGQISKLKLNPGQTKEMIGFSVRHPKQNADSIVQKGFGTLGLKDSRDLDCFGISVEEKMIKLLGRVLSRPLLLYKQNVQLEGGKAWNLDGKSFRTPKALNNWACLRIQQNLQVDKSIRDQHYRGLLEDFLAHVKKKGITISDSYDHGDLFIGDPSHYVKLDGWFRDCLPEFGVTFLIVLLPDNPTSELYNQIKRYGDVKHGIHTVCVKPQKFGKVLQYDQNVALKINLKLGGTNHELEDGSYGCILEDITMVVGIDVTHPAPGAEGAPSVAAVVASCNKYLSQWPADLRINKSRQEIVEMLQEMLTTRLKHFQKVNRQQLPKNILIYRDGVGEGQYKIVLDEELPRLRDACRGVYGSEYAEGVYPQISLIVVGKRHHTRFYRAFKDGTVLDKSFGNPPLGTVVDNTITRDDNWDFFLQSHHAITGTARPAHYFVLLDEIFRKNPNPVHELEKFTFNLCHLYGKATTSVSIPPPVYYADLACGRGKRYLSRVFDQDQSMGREAGDADVAVHDSLKDTMFYI